MKFSYVSVRVSLKLIHREMHIVYIRILRKRAPPPFQLFFSIAFSNYYKNKFSESYY